MGAIMILMGKLLGPSGMVSAGFRQVGKGFVVANGRNGHAGWIGEITWNSTFRISETVFTFSSFMHSEHV